MLYEDNFRSDQQFSSGAMSTDSGAVFEVARGRIVARVAKMGIQFSTQRLLQNVAAIGDQTTIQHSDVMSERGMPWVRNYHSATAPAVFAKAIDLIAVQGR
jgi:predicted Zn-dependent protease